MTHAQIEGDAPTRNADRICIESSKGRGQLPLLPPRRPAAAVTAERLRELLDYNRETGEFRRKISGSNRVKPGAIAGSLMGEGYLLSYVDGRRYLNHRLAWLYVHGHWPAAHVDHINGVRSDNRLANLREASHAQNLAHRVKLDKDNKSGYRGVSWCKEKRKWAAEVRHNGQRRRLGRFDNIEDAAKAYDAAAREMFGEFYSGNALQNQPVTV